MQIILGKRYGKRRQMEEQLASEIARLNGELEKLRAEYAALEQTIGHAEAKAYGRLTELEAEADTLRKQLFAANTLISAGFRMADGDIYALREALADYAHAAWSGWMKYLFSKTETSERFFSGEIVVVIPRWAVDRWQRQMNTPYADLPEEEKKSDREEADKIMGAIARHFTRTWREHADDSRG